MRLPYHPSRRVTGLVSVALLVLALTISSLTAGALSPVAHAAAPTPDALRSVNISVYDTNDQFVNTPSVQALVGAGHPAVVRMPLRNSIPDSYDLTTLQAIKGIGATPLVIVNGAAVANNEPGDAHWLSLVASVFPGGVYVEYGNEEDLAGVSAQAYTASWNSVVSQLAALYPADKFIGPVNFQYNPAYVAYFVQHASPAPYAVSWHEYVCNTGNTDAYCQQHIANWATHVAQTRAAMGAAFATLPIWITEWNLDPNSDPRYSDAAFIGPWIDAALNEWQSLASQGVAVTMLYTADSHGDFGLVGNNNALTPEGTAFYAWSPSGSGTPPPPSPTPNPPPPPTPNPSPTPQPPTPSPTPKPVGVPCVEVVRGVMTTGMCYGTFTPSSDR
jgi:hypothetical protein